MDHPPNLYVRSLTYVVRLVTRYAGVVLLLAAALTLAAIVYSARTLRMNSDPSTLVGRDAAFRHDYREYTRAFPELDEAMLVVITSMSLDRAEDATERLSAALARRTDLVSSVFAPSNEPFFRDHALLYLDQADLARFVNRLAAAQPMLAALSVDPSLRGLFDQFEEALRNVQGGDQKLPVELSRLAKMVSTAAESVLAGTPRKIAWMDELAGNDELVYRVIAVQGRKYFTDPIPTVRLIDGVRETIGAVGLGLESGVQVRLTGMIPLAHEEQQTLRRGLAIATPLSVGLLTVILLLGLRSRRIIIAIFLTLFVSLSCTTAWAMLAVGEFNTISSAFAVLIIGLGDDFAVHIGLRYEEELSRGTVFPEAIHNAVTGVGGGVALCALAAAAAFLSFVPTPYKGLAALGIITGGGMLISLVISLTVFPALLSVIRVSRSARSVTPAAASRIEPFVARHSATVVAASVIVGILAFLVSLQMTFDFNTLGMKDPGSESMTTLRDLQEQGMFTDYSATVLAADMAAAEAVAGRLAALAEVVEVRTPSYYLPQDQQEKLEQIADAAFLLDTALHPARTMPAPTAQQRLASLENLRARILAAAPAADDDEAWVAIKRLGVDLGRIAAPPGAESKLANLEQLVVSDLGEQIGWLRRALAVGEVEFEDLPESLRKRLVSADGRVRVVALPRDDVRDTAALSRFVAAVASVSPRATGRPTIEKAIGDVVIESFRLALILTFLLIAGLLLVALRDPVDVLMAMIPISLAAILTVAFGVVSGMRFNMANVVVIPLVLGLGVDNGIHVLMRFREEHGSLSEVMGSSTPRAVLLSTLTTLAAFGTLAVSPHAGIRSMGVLLTIALLCSLLTTVIVLPAMIALRQSLRARRAG